MRIVAGLCRGILLVEEMESRPSRKNQAPRKRLVFSHRSVFCIRHCSKNLAGSRAAIHARSSKVICVFHADGLPIWVKRTFTVKFYGFKESHLTPRALQGEPDRASGRRFHSLDSLYYRRIHEKNHEWSRQAHLYFWAWWRWSHGSAIHSTFTKGAW